MKSYIRQIGRKVTDEVSSKVALKASEIFLVNLNNRLTEATILDLNYQDSNNIPDVMYYLIHNRFIRIGKKDIDKRTVQLVSKTEIINELNEHWIPGLEPNFILIPEDSNLKFGLYIQGSILYIQRKDSSD